MSTARLLGVVLCGGRSSRMGRDKAILRLPDGQTFIEQAAARLAAVCPTVCLSGPRRYPDLAYRHIADLAASRSEQSAGGTQSYSACRPLRADQDRRGRSRGPICGVAASLAVARGDDFDAILVTPVDMPMLTATHLRRLEQAWRLSPRRAVCVRDRDDLRLQPLVAIYPVQWLETCQRACQSADRSLVRLLATHDHESIELPADACRNVNTPEDLADVQLRF